MYVALSGSIGALTSIMIYMNGVLAQRTGASASSTFIHLTGLVAVALALLVTRSKLPLRRVIRPEAVLGGALGFITVVLASAGFAALGVSLTLGLGLLGQTVASVAIDHFGLLGAPMAPLAWRKAGALALIVAGIGVMSAG